MRSILLALVVLGASGCLDLLYPSRGRPTARLKLSASGVVGSPVELDASESQDPDGKLLVYRFSFDDGSSAAVTGSSTTRHVFKKPGAFNVCVQVTDVETLSDTACRTLHVAVLKVDLGPDQRVDARPDAPDGPDGSDGPDAALDGLADTGARDRPSDKAGDGPRADKGLVDKLVVDKLAGDKLVGDKLVGDKLVGDKSAATSDKAVLPDKKPSSDVTAACFGAEPAGSGGASGYTLKTVPPCAHDASIGGTKLGVFQKDSGKVAFLPFTFSFWGKSYAAVGVSSNGYLQFPGTNPLVLDSHVPAPLPDASSPQNLIAALWSELKPTTVSEVYAATVGQAPNRVYAVQWHVWAAAGTTAPTELTFSVFLYEGTQVIELQYLELVGGSAGAGGLAAVGIENETGTAGVQHSYLKPDGVSTTYGIRFVPK